MRTGDGVRISVVWQTFSSINLKMFFLPSPHSWILGLGQQRKHARPGQPIESVCNKLQTTTQKKDTSARSPRGEVVPEEGRKATTRWAEAERPVPSARRKDTHLMTVISKGSRRQLWVGRQRTRTKRRRYSHSRGTLLERRKTERDGYQ